MKASKKPGNSSNGRSKTTANNWKEKAIERRKEIERLRKRIKELTQSRDRWKFKCKDLKKGGGNPTVLSGEKAAKHQYSLAIIVLIIELYKYGGMSLRSCRHSLCCMFICMGLSSRIPSHSSIRNWLCKCGIYRVIEQEATGKVYVVWIDESITFGSEKLLLILGMPLEEVDFTRSVSHSDLSVLYVGISHEWKADQIEKELQKIAAQKEIRYVVSDQGNNLRKAYKSLDYIHIEDCTHILANHLKRLYEKDADFEAFRKLIGKLRRDWNLSKTKSRYMPPTMRGKMRFANIFPCINWATKRLNDWDDLSAEVQSRLAFLKEKSEFIESLTEVEIIFKTVCTKLKNEGFGSVQKQAILDSLSEMKVGGKASVFIQNCKGYLDNLTMKREALKLECLLCSSDIIESYFGKFKAKVNPNSRSGLTEFMFTIATFGKPFSIKETKNALESIQCKDLSLYKNKAKAA